MKILFSQPWPKPPGFPVSIHFGVILGLMSDSSPKESETLPLSIGPLRRLQDHEILCPDTAKCRLHFYSDKTEVHFRLEELEVFSTLDNRLVVVGRTGKADEYGSLPVQDKSFEISLRSISDT